MPSSVIKPPTSERQAFSRRLKNALDRSGQTRHDLANALGISYGTLGHWLRAEGDCPVGWVSPIATSLGMPVRELVEDPQPPPADPFAQRVVDVLESPLTAPDLMRLLSEARDRLP